MAERSICAVTGSRAGYGLLHGAIRSRTAEPRSRGQIVAKGTPLASEFGTTHKGIERDGFRIDAKVEMLLSSSACSRSAPLKTRCATSKSAWTSVECRGALATLVMSGPGPRASIDSADISSLIHAVRDVEQGLGTGANAPVDSEPFTPERRPGTGLAPVLPWEYIGRVPTGGYGADEIIGR